MQTSITEKQAAILGWIAGQQRRLGVTPTVREIARHFGFRSPRAASDHVDALERKGYLRRVPGQARNLQLVRDGMEDVHAEGCIPIVGDVAAGLPILAQENVLGALSMTESFGSGELFAVRVRGASMIDAGILDGDHVIVRRSPVVEHNTVAVVYIDGEATVKTFRKTATGFELVAANPDYAPIVITADTPGFAIAGPVVGVVRAMKRG